MRITTTDGHLTALEKRAIAWMLEQGERTAQTPQIRFQLEPLEGIENGWSVTTRRYYTDMFDRRLERVGRARIVVQP